MKRIRYVTVGQKIFHNDYLEFIDSVSEGHL